jgi:two-component system OmpR family response regulator
MTRIHILHVDDEPDIREVAELSLGLDPVFVVRSCGSGDEALVVAAQWQPDVILLDVMMPVMDGPATLSRLRDNPLTARIPVIFMTARAQTRELDRFRGLGAIGVIAKPFDPMSLASSVRNYVQPPQDPFAEARAGFLRRVEGDVGKLKSVRASLGETVGRPDALAVIRHIAHGLAGAGGIFGFADISDAGALLEEAVISEQQGQAAGAAIDNAIDHLISRAFMVAEAPGQPLQFLQDA